MSTIGDGWGDEWRVFALPRANVSVTLPSDWSGPLGVKLPDFTGRVFKFGKWGLPSNDREWNAGRGAFKMHIVTDLEGVRRVVKSLAEMPDDASPSPHRFVTIPEDYFHTPEALQEELLATQMKREALAIECELLREKLAQAMTGQKRSRTRPGQGRSGLGKEPTGSVPKAANDQKKGGSNT